MARKSLTNDQLLLKLVKELDPFEAMIVRERLVKIAEISLQNIKEKPEGYDNPIFDHTFYERTCSHILKVIGFK